MHPDEIVHYDINPICLFDINSIQLDSFGMGTNKNSKNILISHDITSEERRRFERNEKKEKKTRKNENEKPERINRSID